MTTREEADQAPQHTWISPRLTRWAVDNHGPLATLSDLRRMPGNSGLSYGFTLTTPHLRDELVIRLPPPGVAHSGNADVLHQARILRAMADAGIPVPEVRSSQADNPWFDVPFYVATLMPGKSTHLFDRDLSSRQDGAGLGGVFQAGMATLAAIHAVDWRTTLHGWAEPQDLADEIRKWTPTLLKSEDQDWIESAQDVADLLMDSRPAAPDLTVVHGDYYSNNWLFENGTITAILDWEISGIGSPGLDLGWICMIYDDESWGPQRHRWTSWSPTPEFLVDAYVAAGGRQVTDLDWYRALAGYRLACITARNFHLHTSGKRHDTAWEVLADAFPHLIQRARQLVLASQGLDA